MSNNSSSFPEVNRLVHEPARLAILTVLSSCDSADFLFLESATGLSRGNLSVQISKLEEAGLIYVEKTIQHKRTLTTISLGILGRREIEQYWQTMDLIRARSQSVTQP